MTRTERRYNEEGDGYLEITYWNDPPNGEYKRQECMYNLQGQAHGLSTFYHPDGMKAEECNWRNGKEHGLTTIWYPNGRKGEEITYESGVHNGRQTRYHHPGGWKQSEIIYKDGEPVEGTAKLWNSRGEEVFTWKESQE